MLNKFTLLLFMLLTAACTKQKPDTNLREQRLSAHDFQKLKVCSSVSFVQNLLEYNNWKDFLVCTDYAKEFPNFYHAFTKISPHDWNHLVMPIDQYFISDLKKRDEFFFYIKQLDKQNGLDDLSHVIKAFLETNLYDKYLEIFNKIENSSASVTKDELFDAMEIIKFDEDLLIDLERSLTFMNKKSIDLAKDFKQEYPQILKDKDFIPAVKDAMDALAISLKERKIDVNDRQLIINVLDQTGDKYSWLVEWILQEGLSEEIFYELLTFNSLKSPSFINNLRDVKSTFPTLECKKQNNYVIKLKTKIQLQEYFKNLADLSSTDFFKFTLDLGSDLALTDSACNMAQINQETNIIKTFNDLNFLFSKIPVYTIAHLLQKNIAQLSNDNLYMLNVLTSDLTKKIDKLSKILTKHPHEKIIFSFYKGLKSLDDETFYSLANIIKYFLKEENFERTVVLANLWMELDDETKLQLIKIFNTILQEDVNTKVILTFFHRVIEEFSSFVPSYTDATIASQALKERTYDSLFSLSKSFQGKKILKDLREFLSRDQILKTIEIIAKGVVVNSYKNYDDYKVSLRNPNYQTKPIRKGPSVVLKDHEENQINIISKCLNLITNHKVSFINYITHLPLDCKEQEVRGSFHQLFQFAHKINIEYSSIFNESNLLTPYGLLGERLLHQTLYNLVLVDKKLRNENDGLSHILKLLKSSLFESKNISENKKGYSRELTELIKSLSLFLNVKDKSKHEIIASSLYSLSLTDNDSIHKFLESSTHSLKNYINMPALIEPTKTNSLKCHKRYAYDFGLPKSCLNSEELTERLFDTLMLANRRLKDRPSFIDLILDGINPDVGRLIPFQAQRQRTYVLNLQDFFVHAHDFNDPEYGKEIEYYEVDENDPKSLGKKVKKFATLAEQVEVVVSDIRFDDGVNGAYFINEIAKSSNLKKELRLKKFLMYNCTKPFTPQCGGVFNKAKRALGLNAYNTFDGLTYMAYDFPHPELGIQNHGDMTQALLGMLIESSSLPAQVSGAYLKLLPKNPKDLKNHNYQLLKSLYDLSLQKQLGYFVSSRFGKSKEELNKNIISPKFQRINNRIFSGYNSGSLKKSIHQFLTKRKTDPEMKPLITESIKWIKKLNSQEQAELEALIGNIAYIMTFIGNQTQCSDCKSALSSESFESLHPEFIFDSLENYYQIFIALKVNFPEQKQLISYVRDLRKLSDIIVTQLQSKKPFAQYDMWFSLNSVFKTLKDLQISSPSFLTLVQDFVNDYPVKFFKSYDALKKILVRMHYEFFEDQFKENKRGLEQLTKIFKSISKQRLVSFTELINYLELNTKSYIEVDNQLIKNPHYLELAKLVNFLGENKNKKTRLEIYLEKIFIKNYDDVNEILMKMRRLIEIEKRKIITP